MQNDREPRKILESAQTEWVARTDASDQPSLPGLDLDSVSPAEATDAIVAFLTRLDQRLARTHDPRARTALLDIDEAAERLRALVSA